MLEIYGKRNRFRGNENTRFDDDDDDDNDDDDDDG